MRIATKSLILPLSILFFAACSSGSKEKVDLKFNLSKGDKFEYSVALNQDAAGVTNKTSMVYLYEVTGDSAGWKNVKATFNRISIDMNGMGRSVKFDTDDSASSANNPTAQIFAGLKGAQFAFTVNDKGEIGKVTGIDEILQKLGIAALAKTFNAESFKQQMQQAFSAYPDKAVTIGESWKKPITTNVNGIEVKTDNTYTLQEVSNSVAKIKVETDILSEGGKVQGMDMSMKGDGKGTIDFDVTSGMPLNSEVKMDIDVTVGSGSTKIPMKLNQTATVKGKKL